MLILESKKFDDVFLVISTTDHDLFTSHNEVIFYGNETNSRSVYDVFTADYLIITGAAVGFFPS